VVGLAWDRYVWPLDTGGVPQPQPATAEGSRDQAQTPQGGTSI
jgi:hypothetical protein